MLKTDVGAATNILATKAPADAESTTSARCWRFGVARLDEHSLELTVNGQVAELDRKPLEVLRHLLRNPGKLVTKDELFAAVWPGRIISDSALTSCMAKLREALQDQQQDIIKTMHGYGYRLVAPVQAEAPSAPAPLTVQAASILTTSPADSVPAPINPSAGGGVPPQRSDLASAPVGRAIPPHRRDLASPLEGEVVPPLVNGGTGEGSALRRYRPALAAALFVSILTLPVLWQLKPHTNSAPPTIAVLPFANLSEDPQTSDYLADGLHDNLITHLARVRNLKVISRTSAMRYRGDTPDVREIGKSLNAGHILEGSVQRIGNRVRVNAQLIDAATDNHLWAEIYDRDVADLFKLQSELAERVAESVGARLTQDERSAIRRNPTESRDAYEWYLQARSEQRIDNTSRDHLFRAKALLERAVADDPEFALAHAALSQVHSLLYYFSYDASPTRREHAKAAADRALALDPDLAEAHLSVGMYRVAGFKDYVGAEQAYRKTLELQPGSAEAHRYLSGVLQRQERWEEALTGLQRAVELDPGNITVVEALAIYLHRALRRYRDADSVYQRVFALAPDDWFRRISYAQFLMEWKGDLTPLRETLDSVPPGVDPDHMVTYFRYLLAMLEGRYLDAAKLMEAYPPEWVYTSGGGRVPKEVLLANAYDRAGERENALVLYRRAKNLLETELSIHPDVAGELLGLALVLAGLGERTQALQAIQRALDLTPPATGNLLHAETALEAATIWTQLGETDRAVKELERLVKIPYGVSAHFLRIEPAFASLRGNPRFEALIAANLRRE